MKNKKVPVIILIVLLVGAFGFWYLKNIPTFRNQKDLSNSQLSQTSQKSIADVDTDGNGVWDYIDTWIRQKYPDNPNIQKSLSLIAKAIQLEMLNSKYKQTAPQVARQIAYSVKCLFKASPDDAPQIQTDLMSTILNTDMRMRAYIEGDGQLGGQIPTQLTNEELAQFCGF